MNHLKSLTFTAVPKGAGNPTATRRAKLVARLEEQRALALDPGYAPTRRHTVKGEDGARQTIDSQRRLRPWWRADANGGIVLTVRYGFKTIEFEKGKAGVAVQSKDRLVSVIDTMIAAVRAGELDEVLAQQSKAGGKLKARKAT